MSTTVRFCLSVIITSCICSPVTSGRNYDYVLSDIKCKFNRNYALKSSCELFGDSPSTGANFDLQMRKSIKDFRIDLEFFLKRKTKYDMLLFKAPNVDVCTELKRNVTVPVVQMFKEMTLKAGKWPECPVPANYHFHFENLSSDLNYFPSYLPEVGLKIKVILKDGQKMFSEANIFGKIVYKKSIKGPNKH